jgi:hypothetical protein
MKLAVIFSFLSLLVFGSGAGAENSGAYVSNQVIQSEVDRYYAELALMENLNSVAPEYNDCVPTNVSGCVNAACNRLGSFGCNDISKVEPVSKACRGSYGGGCLEAACSKFNSFECSDFERLEGVIIACRGNYDGSCVNQVCSRIGSFGCNSIEKVIRVAKSCGGND